MAASSKRTYATHHTSQDCCCQSPCPRCRPLLTHVSTRDPQMVKGRSVSFSSGGHCSFSWSWCTQGFVCALPESLAGIRFDFQCDCSLPTTLLWLLICPSHPYLFLVGANILLSMVVQQLVVILVFSQKMSVCPSSLPS